MKSWTDLGRGQWKLTITADDDPTGPPSVFRGTKEEIADKLADSQANANRRISELRRSNGHAAPNSPPPANPRALSPEERMTTVAELSNPATVDKAVTRVMESVIGPVADFQKDRQSEREQRQVQAAEAAALEFFETTPDWHPSEHNKATMTRFVFAQRLDPSKVESYRQAFDELSAAQLLQAKPMEDDNDNEPAADQGRNAPVTPTPAPKAPTRYSTSIRSSDISGTPPVPSGKPRLKYTREQLANISAKDYKQLMLTDRTELERCEQYYAKNPVRRAS